MLKKHESIHTDSNGDVAQLVADLPCQVGKNLSPICVAQLAIYEPVVFLLCNIRTGVFLICLEDSSRPDSKRPKRGKRTIHIQNLKVVNPLSGECCSAKWKPFTYMWQPRSFSFPIRFSYEKNTLLQRSGAGRIVSMLLAFQTVGIPFS